MPKRKEEPILVPPSPMIRKMMDDIFGGPSSKRPVIDRTPSPGRGPTIVEEPEPDDALEVEVVPDAAALDLEVTPDEVTEGEGEE